MTTGETCEAAVLLLSPEVNLCFQDFAATEEDMILLSNPVLSLHVEGVRGGGCGWSLLKCDVITLSEVSTSSSHRRRLSTGVWETFPRVMWRDKQILGLSPWITGLCTFLKVVTESSYILHLKQSEQGVLYSLCCPQRKKKALTPLP